MEQTKVRKMTFGKYKGRPILSVIAEHIGYIMWCFENIDWWRLTEEEQMFYDWVAIGIKKYGLNMTFPVKLMYKYVKDQEALEKLETPYVDRNGYSYIPKDTPISHLLIEAGVIIKKKSDVSPAQDTAFLGTIDLTRHFTPMISKELDNMSDEEIEDMVQSGITLPFLK